MSEFTLTYENVEYPGICERAEAPVASLLLLHGIGEHVTRFSRVFSFFAERGISVYGFDLPGHGMSPGIRGHIGKRTEFFRMIDEAISIVRAETPDVPFFLMGHSMGGNLALSYRLLRREAPIAGYVISSPWLVLGNPPGRFSQTFLPLLAKIAPHMTLDSGVRPELLYTPSEEVPPEKSPLVHPLITPLTAYESFGWAKKILEMADVDRPPVYLFHGTDDGICDVDGSRAFAKAAGSLCVFREWTSLKHETLNERKWRDVAGGAADWVLSRASAVKTYGE